MGSEEFLNSLRGQVKGLSDIYRVFREDPNLGGAFAYGGIKGRMKNFIIDNRPDGLQDSEIETILSPLTETAGFSKSDIRELLAPRERYKGL